MGEKASHTFDDLIQHINQTAGDIQRERGTLFEKLVLSYLCNEPTVIQECLGVGRCTR